MISLSKKKTHLEGHNAPSTSIFKAACLWETLSVPVQLSLRLALTSSQLQERGHQTESMWTTKGSLLSYCRARQTSP